MIGIEARCISGELGTIFDRNPYIDHTVARDVYARSGRKRLSTDRCGRGEAAARIGVINSHTNPHGLTSVPDINGQAGCELKVVTIPDIACQGVCRPPLQGWQHSGGEGVVAVVAAGVEVEDGEPVVGRIAILAGEEQIARAAAALTGNVPLGRNGCIDGLIAEGAKGRRALLQHPIGVAVFPGHSIVVHVAGLGTNGQIARGDHTTGAALRERRGHRWAFVRFERVAVEMITTGADLDAGVVDLQSVCGALTAKVQPSGAADGVAACIRGAGIW